MSPPTLNIMDEKIPCVFLVAHNCTFAVQGIDGRVCMALSAIKCNRTHPFASGSIAPLTLHGLEYNRRHAGRVRLPLIALKDMQWMSLVAFD